MTITTTNKSSFSNIRQCKESHAKRRQNAPITPRRLMPCYITILLKEILDVPSHNASNKCNVVSALKQ
jgi:hypothetical protein